jgi:hypothetical protein
MIKNVNDEILKRHKYNPKSQAEFAYPGPAFHQPERVNLAVVQHRAQWLYHP